MIHAYPNPNARTALRTCTALLAATVALTALPAHADHDGEHLWDGGPNGLFGTPANWNPAAVPGRDDDAVFDITQNFGIPSTVTLERDHRSDQLIVRNGDVIFALDRGDYRLRNSERVSLTPDVSLIVGQHGGDEADLTVRNVADFGIPLVRTRDVAIGAAGTGRITLDGRTRIISDTIHLGRDAGSKGTMVLNDPQARWDADRMLVGQLGDGVLRVQAGSLEINQSVGLTINNSTDSTGQVVVSGPDSSLNVNGEGLGNAGQLVVGNRGTGTMLIEDGARVRSYKSMIGRFNDSNGTVTVKKNNARWDAHSLDIRDDGTLNVLPGGTVDVQTTLQTRDGATINLYGGTLRFQGYDRIGGNNINYTAGTVQLGGDRLIHAGNTVVQDFFNGALAISRGKGLVVEGQATLVEPVTIDGGTLGVGQLGNPHLLDFFSGTLNFVGDDGLEIGFDGPLGSNVILGGSGPFGDGPPPQHINVVHHDGNRTNTATIAPEGVLEIHPGSSFGGRQIENRGEIRLLGPGARLNGDTIQDDEGGTVTNHGLIVGLGRITAQLDNRTAGEVRTVTPPQPEVPERIDLADGDPADITVTQRMVFTAAGNTNAGRITINAGHSIEFLQDLTNETGGEIALDQNAALHVNDGLTNRGGITIHGDAGLHGPITVTADTSAGGQPSNAGRLSVVNNATGTVFGDLENNGRVQVNDGSRLLMLGNVTGGGDFAGTGTVEFAGQFSPGNSPGDVNFGGDVILNGGQLLMELAGLTPGEQFDHLDIAGRFQIDGDLEIALLEGFTPEPGDTFNLFDFADLDGAFTNLILPELAAGEWDTTGLQSEGTVTVIPEPATAALLALAGLCLLRRHTG